MNRKRTYVTPKTVNYTLLLIVVLLAVANRTFKPLIIVINTNVELVTLIAPYILCAWLNSKKKQ